MSGIEKHLIPVHSKMLDRETCMSHWFPIIRDLGVPIPKTTLIPFSAENLSFRIDRDAVILNDEPMEKIVEAILAATLEMNTDFPIFIRTGMTSGKFDWSDTCFVENRDRLEICINHLVEYHFMHDIPLIFDGFAVREVLDLDWMIHIHNNLPVPPEIRVFIRDGRVSCWHEYWERFAIAEGLPREEDWQDLFEKMDSVIQKEHGIVLRYAEVLASVLKDWWSLDFARDRKGRWWFIDAARGEISHHKRYCEFDFREMKKR